MGIFCSSKSSNENISPGNMFLSPFHHDLSLSALAREFPARHWGRENTIRQHIAQIPTRRSLCFPCPKDPTSGALKGVKLCLDEPTHIVLVLLRKPRNGPSRFTSTTTNSRAPRKSTIVSGSLPIPIEVLGAISHSTSPLSRNGPLVITSHLFSKIASSADMSSWTHTDL